MATKKKLKKPQQFDLSNDSAYPVTGVAEGMFQSPDLPKGGMDLRTPVPQESLPSVIEMVPPQGMPDIAPLDETVPKSEFDVSNDKEYPQVENAPGQVSAKKSYAKPMFGAVATNLAGVGTDAATGAGGLRALSDVATKATATTVGNLQNPAVLNTLGFGALAARSAKKIYDDVNNPNSELADGIKNIANGMHIPDAIQARNLKVQGVDKSAKAVGKTIADVASGEGLPKDVADYAIKPTLDALGEGLSTIANKAGIVENSVEGSKLGGILSAILGGAGYVAKEAISRTAYGEPFNILTKGIAKIGQGLDTAMAPDGTAPASVGTASFQPATEATYKARKKELSKPDQRLLQARGLESISKALPKLNELLKAQFDKNQGVSPVATATANVPVTSTEKPGMINRLGNSLLLSPEQETNINNFNKNYDKGYWDTVMARAVGQKDIGLPRIPIDAANARQEAINKRSEMGRGIQLWDKWHKLSKDNMNMNQSMNDLVGLLAEGTKASDSALLYALCKLSDKGGRVTDADIDNYKKFGTDATGMIKEWFNKYTANGSTLLPQHKKELVDVAFNNWSNAAKTQGTNRDHFTKYAGDVGVDSQTAIDIVEHDNFGPMGTTPDYNIKEMKKKIEAAYEKIGGTAEVNIDPNEEGWINAFNDPNQGPANQIGETGYNLLASWKNSANKKHLWDRVKNNLSAEVRQKLQM